MQLFEACFESSLGVVNCGGIVLQLLAFETYRDLVKLLQQNLSEEQGIIAAELRNIEERASARSAAAAAVGVQPGQSSGLASSTAPAGKAAF